MFLGQMKLMKTLIMVLMTKQENYIRLNIVWQKSFNNNASDYKNNH